MRKVLSFVMGMVIFCGAALAQVSVKPVDGTGAELSTLTRAYTATIAISGTVSSVVTLNGCTPIRILMPTTAAGWTASNITFSYSEDNTNWLDLTDQYGSAITVVAAANKAIQLEAGNQWLGIKYIKLIVSAQEAARTVTIICKPF